MEHRTVHRASTVAELIEALQDVVRESGRDARTINLHRMKDARYGFHETTLGMTLTPQCLSDGSRVHNLNLAFFEES